MDAVLDAQEKHAADFRVIRFELGYGPEHKRAVRAFLEAKVNSGLHINYTFSERHTPKKA